MKKETLFDLFFLISFSDSYRFKEHSILLPNMPILWKKKDNPSTCKKLINCGKNNLESREIVS